LLSGGDTFSGGGEEFSLSWVVVRCHAVSISHA
jgi:hypothetical protein